MYKISEETRKNMESFFENKLGISYEEYSKLDFDAQQRLISEYQKRIGRSKSDKVTAMIGSGDFPIFTNVNRGQRIMIGSGEDSCFVRAGITPQQAKIELDDRIDDALYCAPVAFVKKMQRRIKNKY